MTITFALFSGLQRRWAAEYSFFLAIPTILAATLVQPVSVILDAGAAALDFRALAIGFVAFGVLDHGIV